MNDLQSLRRHLLSLILAATFLFAGPSTGQAAHQPLNLYVNGFELFLPAPPVIRNDRVMVPLRGYLEAVGGTVTWQPPNQIAVSLSGRSYLFTTGSPTVQTESSLFTMEAPAQIIGGHTYIHVRFLESLGASFTFDGRAVRVTTPSAGYLRVVDGPLNVRQSPSTTAPILTAFPVGTTLEVIQVQGAWTEVKLPRGTTGWLANQFTHPAAPPPELGPYGEALNRGNAYAEANGSCIGQSPIVGNKLYIPLRESVSRLGGQTTWESGAAVVRLNGQTLTVPSSRTGATLNGSPYPMDDSILIDGQMLVPARAFADAMGLGLVWDEVRRTARISGGGSSPAGAIPCNPDAPLQAYIIMDLATGQVLAEYHANRPMQVASTTKMMTALLAIERGQPDSMVTVSQRASRMIGASLGLVAGERMRLDDMLLGMMLRSGNDAAAAIAEHLGGTEAHFAQVMTARAAELGATNTLFLNASGLDDDERPVSTAADLALIARHALHSNEFRAVASTPSATLPGPNGVRRVANSNDFVTTYAGATGVKNGWTELADHTLVASAYRGGRELIVVALGAGSRAQLYSQTGRLMDIGFGLADASWVLQSIGQ